MLKAEVASPVIRKDKASTVRNAITPIIPIISEILRRFAPREDNANDKLPSSEIRAFDCAGLFIFSIISILEEKTACQTDA
jgi:hypothetical protein